MKQRPKDTEGVARWWYKAYGFVPAGGPFMNEGGVHAGTPQGALGAVRGLSTAWNAREIYWIGIYPVDEYGILNEKPVLVWSSADDEAEPKEPKQSALLLPDWSKETSSTIEVFESAEWLDKEIQFEPFPTVKMREPEEKTT